MNRIGYWWMIGFLSGSALTGAGMQGESAMKIVVAFWGIAAAIGILNWREKRDMERRPWRYMKGDSMTRVERMAGRMGTALFRAFIGKPLDDLVAETGLDRKSFDELWAARVRYGYMKPRTFAIAWNRGYFRDWPIVDGKLVKPAGAVTDAAPVLDEDVKLLK